MVGQTIEVNGVNREVIGVLAAGADVMDNRTEIWLPLGLNPANRQNRGNHFLYLIGRLKEGVHDERGARRARHARAQLGRARRGEAARLHARRTPHADEAAAGRSRRQRAAIDLGAAGSGRVRAADCVREPRQPAGGPRRNAPSRVRGADRARRRPRTAAPPVHDRGRLAIGSSAARSAWCSRARASQTIVRLYPDSLPRTSELAVDPPVLLFTLGLSLATGVVFGLAPLMHTRIKALAAALKEGGARGRPATARHLVRRGLVVAEVALAVMLVTGAGLLLRTVYNLVERRRRVRSLAARHVPDGVARRELSARRRPRPVVSTPARAAARRPRRPGARPRCRACHRCGR